MACEQIFESVDAIKKFENTFFTKKNTPISTYQERKNARREAIVIREDRENIVSYASPIRTYVASAHGRTPVRIFPRVNNIRAINPAITNFRDIDFPYICQTISVVINTIGRKNTARERCVPRKNGIVFMPRRFDAKRAAI
jgi:hypothetical protein